MFEFLFNCRKIILLLLINNILFIKMSTNYEKLYNDLKEEFEQNKSDIMNVFKLFEKIQSFLFSGVIFIRISFLFGDGEG